MSSSQGGNTTTVTNMSYPYAYYADSMRDASDWIRQLKEKRAYYSYSTKNTGNKNTSDPWLKYGNQFRLTYAFGKFKCETCNANAIVPAVIGSS